MEKLAFETFALAAISHKDDVLGWPGRLPPIAKYALTYVFVQAEFGLCCPVSMTDSHPDSMFTCQMAVDHSIGHGST